MDWRRAQERRWRRLIEDGAFDVTEEFGWVRRESRDIAVMPAITAPVLAWASSNLWHTSRPRPGAMPPGYEWVEWLAAAGIVASPALIMGPILVLLWPFLRVRTRMVRVTREWIEGKWANGERRWAWRGSAGVRRSGTLITRR